MSGYPRSTARLPAWRGGQVPSLSRTGRWYLAVAVSLTVLWLVARGFAPPTGLTRSYHYPYAPLVRSTEPVLEQLATPVVEDRITAVDLAFLDERGHPVTNYLVRWNGVWFSPRPERIDFHAAADDGLVLRLDGEIVIERSSGAGMAPAVRTVELDAGAHRLEIDHWQHGGASGLSLEWAPAGGDSPVPLSRSRLFAEDPGASAYRVLAAAPALRMLVLLIWGAIPTLLFVRMVHREISALTRRELATRLRVVLFPALLGPSQLLIFGPWTVHATNRTEFLVSFWNLAPRWLWLLGPIVAGLAALGIVLPGRWFPRYVAALCAVGVLLWVQGNLLVADYGLLDGAGLDLASHAWRAPAEAGLWMGGIALATFLAGAVVRAAPLASTLLMALQTAVLLLPAIAPAVDRASAPRTARVADTGWQLPPERIYELSRTRNLIHIVLDMFPAHVFAAIAAVDGPAFDDDWSGFTFFRDHLGAFRTTKASMPAMLTGVAYRNELPFNEFRARRANVIRPACAGATGLSAPVGDTAGRRRSGPVSARARCVDLVPHPVAVRESAGLPCRLGGPVARPVAVPACTARPEGQRLQRWTVASPAAGCGADGGRGGYRTSRRGHPVSAGVRRPDQRGGRCPGVRPAARDRTAPADRRGCGLPVPREKPAGLLHGQLRRAGAVRVERCPGPARQTPSSRSLRPRRHRRDIRSRIGRDDSR